MAVTISQIIFSINTTNPNNDRHVQALLSLYRSFILTALGVTEQQQAIPQIIEAVDQKFRLLTASLWATAGYPSKYERVNIHQSTSCILSTHFETHYPEVVIYGRSLPRKTHTSFSADFIVGVLLAVTGAGMILCASVAMLFVSGLIPPLVVGGLGSLGLFAGTLLMEYNQSECSSSFTS